MPVVSIGGQETPLVRDRGERLAHALALDRAFHLHVLPISLALPWGINVGSLRSRFLVRSSLSPSCLTPSPES